MRLLNAITNTDVIFGIKMDEGDRPLKVRQLLHIGGEIMKITKIYREVSASGMKYIQVRVKRGMRAEWAAYDQKIK